MGLPAGLPLMAIFWQYLQPKVQPPKKIAPLPPFPASAGSSHLWIMAFATSAVLGAPQKPFSPSVRFTPQRRGQSSQFV
jgi:hypothetical protein